MSHECRWAIDRRSRCVWALALVVGLPVPAIAQEPFPCDNSAYVIQRPSAELFIVEQTTPGYFVLTPIGPPAGFEINNLGFRRTDGLLYGWHRTSPPLDPATQEFVSIDRSGSVTSLGLGGLPVPSSAQRFTSGDVSFDGGTMFLNLNGRGLLYKVLLPALDPVTTVPITDSLTLEPVTSGNRVSDWAFNRVDGLLYGGDDTDGEIAVLDPSNGLRTDRVPLPCMPVTSSCDAASLPTGAGFGGAWFDFSGSLFLYRNDGHIYEIADPGTEPRIVATQSGLASDQKNDGAACLQRSAGAAKEMTSQAGNGLPSTITIVYTLENLNPDEALTMVSAQDDLAAVFGVTGTDWAFDSIDSSPESFANPGFNGSSDIELVDQSMGGQSLAPAPGPGHGATVTVTLTLLTHDGAPDPLFCNQIVMTGRLGGVTLGDVSTNGPFPDPNGDGFPDEREPSCFEVPVELMSFSIE